MDNRSLTARNMLDARWQDKSFIKLLSRPQKGWIRAIREGLGMTAIQFAKRLRVSAPRITQMERSEISGTLTMASLEAAAHALNCEFIYAIVPKTSLQEIVKNRAEEKARELLQRVGHSMSLENQSVDNKTQEAFRQALIDSLLNEQISKLWDDQN